VGLDSSELGYGPTVILQHSVCLELQGEEAPVSLSFYSLYGHLSHASVFGASSSSSSSTGSQPALLQPLLPVGSSVAQGQLLGRLGSPVGGENGGWFPHVHFQLITELGLGGWQGDYSGVCRRQDWPAFCELTLDPNLLLRCPWVQPLGWSPEGSRAAAAGIKRVSFS
jgi:hypothetical protein